MTETVTRLRPQLVENRYGGDEKNWDAATALTVRECLVAPRVEGEDRANGREGVVVGWTVYAPHGTDVLATDRVRVRGRDFDVDGEPADWSGGFSGWEAGVVIQTRAVQG